MSKLMNILFKKGRCSWAPKFLTALKQHEYLGWIVEKIDVKSLTEEERNETDIVKQCGNFCCCFAC